MDARVLAERMYQRRREQENLRTTWTKMKPAFRQSYVRMAETAIDEITKVLLRKAIEKGSGMDIGHHKQLVAAGLLCDGKG